MASAVAQENPSTVGNTFVLDGSGSDPDGDALSYAWTLTAKGPGSQASISGANNARATFAPDVPGLYRFRLEVRDPSGSMATTEVESQAYPAGDPQIVLSAVEPLQGTVRLSISPPLVGIASVTWMVNGTVVGSAKGSGTGVDQGFDWDTLPMPNGTYEVTASAQGFSPFTRELRRTVQIFNPSLYLTATAPEGTATVLDVFVQARSPQGVDSVNVKVGGVDGGTLTAPTSGTDSYLFHVNSGLPPGTHTLVVTATDGVDTRSVQRAVHIASSTVLAVDSPADGAFVFGSLSLRGSASTNEPGATLGVTAYLLGQTIAMPLTGTLFDRSFDWSGTAPGRYDVTVETRNGDGPATAVSHSVVRVSSASLAYIPAVVLPDGGELLAADGTQVLYHRIVRGGIDLVVLRDLVTGVERSLPDMDFTTFQRVSDWQLAGGNVFAESGGMDCATSACIFRWSPDGTRINLTATNPFYAGRTPRSPNFQQGILDVDRHPQARDGYVMWKGWFGGFMIYEVATGTYRHMEQPAGVLYLAEGEVAQAGGVLRVVYWGEVPGSNQWDIWAWDSASLVTTRLTSDRNNTAPQSDGVRAAWYSTDGVNYSLTAQVLAGGPPTIVSTRPGTFFLRDGLLAWEEYSSSSSATLKVSTSSGTVDVATGQVHLLQAGGGHVVYSLDGRVHDWNAATGQSTLKIEATPGPLTITGGAMVFGQRSSIYRLPY